MIELKDFFTHSVGVRKRIVYSIVTYWLSYTYKTKFKVIFTLIIKNLQFNIKRPEIEASTEHPRPTTSAIAGLAP